jgi:hypothetical protein
LAQLTPIFAHFTENQPQRFGSDRTSPKAKNGGPWTDVHRFRDGSPLLTLAIFVEDIRRWQP